VLPEGANAFMRVLADHLIANCASLLHTKIKDNNTISGYCGGATHGYNLAAIEGLQTGLGVFLDTSYVAFKMPRGGIVKILQYCQKVGRFPLHNDEPRDKRLFRISERSPSSPKGSVCTMRSALTTTSSL
jgi:hypothetical protein